MRCLAVFLLVLSIGSKVAPSQTRPGAGEKPFDSALIGHSAGMLLVRAHEPRPLRQALDGIREEYGWVVDYEDPIYLGQDVMDDTAPSWRALHPGERGVTRVAGEAFSFNVPEPADNPSAPREGTLKAIVDAFSASGNPGAFIVLNEGNKRYAIVGKMNPATRAGQPEEGILGVTVDLPVSNRSAMDALTAICEQVSQNTGRKVFLGVVPTNLMLQSQTQVGGSGIVARTLLAKVLDSTGTNLVWEAIYGYDDDMYFINIVPAVQNYYDVKGKRVMHCLRLDNWYFAPQSLYRPLSSGGR